MTELLEHFNPLLKSLLLPPGGLLLLLLLGLLLGRRLFGRLLSWSALLGLYLLSSNAATLWLGQYVETIAPISADQLAQAQAILVLGAGYTRDNPELAHQASADGMSAERLSYASRLHHESGLPIIISGGRLYPEDEAVAQTMARWLRERAQIEPLALETQSTNTWENLQYSAELLKELGLQKVALVTHAYHMPRAMLAAQQHPIDVIPAPFDYLGPGPQQTTDYSDPYLWLPDARHMAANYLLTHELLGMLWYRLKKTSPDRHHSSSHH